MNEEKKRIIEILTALKNNFDYTDVEDYRNTILFLNSCIENNETDVDIIAILNNIIKNIKKVNVNIDKRKNRCPHSCADSTPFYNKDKDFSNEVYRTKKLWENLPKEEQKIFSYRILCPRDANYNYMKVR